LPMRKVLRKGQIRAEVLHDIPASRWMKRGRPHFALVLLLPHDGLEEELALAYYEELKDGSVDESSVRLIRFDRTGAARLPSLLERAARISKAWSKSESTLEAWGVSV